MKFLIPILCVVLVVLAIYFIVPKIPQLTQGYNTQTGVKNESSPLSMAFDLGFSTANKSPVYDAQGKAIEAAIPGNVENQKIQNTYDQQLLDQTLPGAVAAQNSANQQKIEADRLATQNNTSKVRNNIALRYVLLGSILFVVILGLVLAYYFAPRYIQAKVEAYQTSPRVTTVGTKRDPKAYLITPSLEQLRSGVEPKTAYVFPGLPKIVDENHQLSPEEAETYMRWATLKAVLSNMANLMSRRALQENGLERTTETIKAFQNMIQPRSSVKTPPQANQLKKE